MHCLISATAAYCITRGIDQGLADFMGLATLRHGTDPWTWGALHLLGTEPRLDRTPLGNRAFSYINSCDDYGLDFIPLWNAFDERFKFTETWETNKQAMLNRLPPYLQTLIMKIARYALYTFTVLRLKTLLARAYPLLGFAYQTGPVQMALHRIVMYGLPIVQKATANYRRLDPRANKWTAPFKLAAIPGISLMTPTVKVRLAPHEFDASFQEIFPLSGRVILLKEDRVSADHIGFLGTIRGAYEQGFPPIFSSPLKIVKGACVLTALS